MSAPLLAFRPHTFSSFDTFRCPKQYRLATGPKQPAGADGANSHEMNPVLQRGIDFERDVIEALKKAANLQQRVGLLSSPPDHLVSASKAESEILSKPNKGLWAHLIAFNKDANLDMLIIDQLELVPPQGLLEQVLKVDPSQVGIGSIMKPDIVILRKEDSGIKISIADIKSSSHPKRYHRMQIAFYDITIEHALKVEVADHQNTIFGKPVVHDPIGQIWLPLSSTDLRAVGSLTTVGSLHAGQWGCIRAVDFQMEGARHEVHAFFKHFVPLALKGTAIKNPSTGAIEDIEDIPFELRPRCGMCDYVEICQRGAQQSASMMLGMKRFGEAGDAPLAPILESVPTTTSKQWVPLPDIQQAIAASETDPSDFKLLKSLIATTLRAQSTQTLMPLPDKGINSCPTIDGLDQKGIFALGKGDYAIVRFSSVAISGTPGAVSGEVHSPTYAGGLSRRFKNASELVESISKVAKASVLVVFSSADRQRLLTALYGVASDIAVDLSIREQTVNALLKFSDGIPSRLIAMRMNPNLFDIGSHVERGRIISVIESLDTYFALPIPRACLAGDVVQRQLLSMIAPSTSSEQLLPNHVARLLALLSEANVSIPVFSVPAPFTQLLTQNALQERLKDVSADAATALHQMLLVEQTIALEHCAAAQRTMKDDDGPLKNGPIAVQTQTAALRLGNSSSSIDAEVAIITDPLQVASQWAKLCDPKGYFADLQSQLESAANAQLDDFKKANILGVPSISSGAFEHLKYYTEMPFRVPGTTLDVAWATVGELLEHNPQSPKRKQRLYVILLPATRGSPTSPVQSQQPITIGGHVLAPITDTAGRILVLQTAFSAKFVPRISYLVPRATDINVAAVLGKLKPHPTFLQYLVDGVSEVGRHENTEMFSAFDVPVETYDATLSEDQQAFIKRIPQHKVTCLWGPPGTGKSFTLSVMLLKFLVKGTQWDRRQDSSPPLKILVVAFTKSVVADLKDSLTKLAGGIVGQQLTERNVSKTSAWPVSVTVGKASVHFSTVWQAIKEDNIPPGGYDMLVVDEASQLRACHALLASSCLKKPSTSSRNDDIRIILAGDMLQLSPIVPSTAAAASWAMGDEDQLLVLGSILEASLFKGEMTNGSLFKEHLRAEEIISAGKQSARQLLPANLIQLHVTRRGQGRKLIQFVGHIYPRYEPTPTVAAEAKDRSGLFVCKLEPEQVLEETDVLVSILRNKVFFGDPAKHPASIGIVTPHRKQRVLARRSVSQWLQQSGINASIIEGEKKEVKKVVKEKKPLAQSPASTMPKTPSYAVAAAAPPMFATPASKVPFDEDNVVASDSDAEGNEEIIQLDEEGDPCHITIDTVERMQGLEFDVVIVLLANVSLNFVLNINRLNVAFSRARKDLFLVVATTVLNPDPDVLDSLCHQKGFMPLVAAPTEKQKKKKTEGPTNRIFQDDPPNGNLELDTFSADSFDEPPTHKGQATSIEMATKYLQRFATEASLMQY